MFFEEYYDNDLYQEYFMCGIIGYAGAKQAVPLIIDGLKKLEYRGYDSSGAAVTSGSGIHIVKSVGKIEKLEEKLNISPLTILFSIKLFLQIIF